jgi:hypothetical protein
MVSEFEGINMDEMWKLPTIQFLNDMLYLKEKQKCDAELEKQLLKKYKNGSK